MAKKNNCILITSGELFGFPTEASITMKDGKLLVAGSLETKGKKTADLIQNKELDVGDIAGKLTVIPKKDVDFSVQFAKCEENYAFLLHTSGIYCGITLASGSKRLLLAMDTEKLKTGNNFERFVAEASNWAGIKSLLIIAQNNYNAKNNNDLLKLIAGKNVTFTDIPKGYEKYQLIAVGVFILKNNGFGKCLNILTGLDQLQFAVGGNFTDGTFGTKLTCNKIENKDFTIENLAFELEKTKNSFFCTASGKFIFKLENNHIGFTLSGALSNTSFVLSAASLDNTKIPLNTRLSFSDLALSIGIDKGKVSFAMAGRLNTNNNLSLFAGFAVSPPRITLLTAALTSTSGKITLKDLVQEIADIQWDLVNCLDVIAIGDFDLTDTSLSKGITGFPTNNNDEHYDETKTNIEREVITEFNRKVANELKISGGGQLTPLGNNSNQYILTDKGTMRHYRIDKSGKISLNCQIYICSKETILGQNKMPVGFFICGTLEIFNLKARFLFSVDKGKSLIALVQLKKIKISGIFELGKSKKALPISPINGGIAGQLIQPGDDGAVMYLNINKGKGDLTFYLSANISILGIFTFDSLVLIKDRNVFVNIEYLFFGFKITLNLQGSYTGFNTAGFNASVIFDTSGFLEIMKAAQESLKAAAKSVRLEIENATRKLTEAQQQVRSLENQITNLNNRIAQCRKDISKAKWYQLWIKVARLAEIAALYLAQAGVYTAIGVAVAALEVAKSAVKLGGAVVSTMLDSLAVIINTVTQILWIKSFELGINASITKQSIKAKLVLIVFGKEVPIEGELKIEGLADNVKKFVSGGVKNKSDDAIKKIKNGDIDRTIVGNGDLEGILDGEFIAEYGDIRRNSRRYEELSQLYDTIEELFVGSNNAYFEAYNEECVDWRESACRLDEIRWEEEIFRNQHCESFDDEFVESLETVITTIQQTNADREEISNEKGQRMDDLLGYVKMTNSKKNSRDEGNKKRESLFSTLEKGVDQKWNKFRSDLDKEEKNAEEANEQYAEKLSQLFKENLGDKTDEVSEELKVTFDKMMFQFKNKFDND